MTDMSVHWKRISVLLVLTVGVFGVALATQHYMFAIFVLLASIFGLTGYAIGSAHFKNRPDDRPDNERQHDPPI
jgi:hypothetical protein